MERLKVKQELPSRIFGGRRTSAAVLALGLLAWGGAQAGPNEYVRTPIVSDGEREIDFKTGVQRNRDGRSEAAHALGLGLTPLAGWFSEVYVKYARPAGESQGFDAWEWENRFQLTETGRHAVDLGLLLEVERPKDRAEGYEITWGPMLQKEWGRVQGNMNLFWHKHVRAAEPSGTRLLYQAQLKYRQAEALEWGVQAMGSLGTWDAIGDLGQQEGKLGPALFGKIRAGTHEAIRWNAAWLAGTTHASPSSTLRLQVEYEF